MESDLLPARTPRCRYIITICPRFQTTGSTRLAGGWLINIYVFATFRTFTIARQQCFTGLFRTCCRQPVWLTGRMGSCGFETRLLRLFFLFFPQIFKVPSPVYVAVRYRWQFAMPFSVWRYLVAFRGYARSTGASIPIYQWPQMCHGQFWGESIKSLILSFSSMNFVHKFNNIFAL